MKNLWLLAAFFLLVSCANESPKPKSSETKIAEAKTVALDAKEDSNKPPATTPSMTTEPSSFENVETKEAVTATPSPEKAVKKVEKTNNNTFTKKKLEKQPLAKKQSQVNEVKEKPEVIASTTQQLQLEKEKKKVEAERQKLVAQKMQDEADARKRMAASQAAKAEAEKRKAAALATLHDGFDALLKKYVSSTGKVNYSGFKNDEAKLDTYLTKLESTPIGSNWGSNQKMAYWINAYNAYTIKLILKNYPVSSITKLHGGKPWDVKWIELNGKTLSLNNIENDILRPQYKDARIHFAVNCAAKSCPPLLNKAWTAANLNANFEKQAKAFINNPQFNTIAKDKIEVSKIFEWYAEDFDNLINYLNKYSTTQISSGAKIGYKEYDWALNK
ncbi:MAG: DUF547 domain-containing protein [Bacteroidota bacterium]